MNENSFVKKLIDATLLIAALTAFLYLGNYIYLKTHNQIFKVPVFLVNVNADTLLSSSLNFLKILIIGFGLPYVLVLITLSHKRTSFILLIVSINLLLEYYILAELFFQETPFSNVWLNKSLSDVFSHSLLFACVLPPSITIIISVVIGYVIKKSKTLVRMIHLIVEQRKILYETKYFIMHKIKYFIYFFCYITGVVSILGIVQVGCLFDSRNSTEYFVTSKDEKIIIVGKNNDFLIGKPYSTDLNVCDRVLLIKITESSTIEIKKKDIGHLNFDYSDILFYNLLVSKNNVLQMKYRQHL